MPKMPWRRLEWRLGLWDVGLEVVEGVKGINEANERAATQRQTLGNGVGSRPIVQSRKSITHLEAAIGKFFRILAVLLPQF